MGDTIRKGKMERRGMEIEKGKAKVSAITLAAAAAAAAMYTRRIV